MDIAAHNIASIAASGFALTGYCIAADRGWVSEGSKQKKERETRSIFLPTKRFTKTAGFIIGSILKRAKGVGTARFLRLTRLCLLGGVLSVKQCFSDDKEIVQLADKISDRVDYKWMQGDNQYLLISRMETRRRIFEKSLGKITANK